MKREEVGPSSVVLGVECGGSDFSSSLSSNPVVGYVADDSSRWEGESSSPKPPRS